MMINLIPTQLKRERKLKAAAGSASLAVALLIIVIAIISELLGYLAGTSQSRLKSIEDKISTANKSAEQYGEIEQKINQINGKLVKIETVNKNRPLWSLVIAEFEKSVPVQTSINSLSMDQATGTLVLSGQAESRREIAKFKEKMESSPFFKDVYFSSSAYQSGQNNFSFSITANLERVK